MTYTALQRLEQNINPRLIMPPPPPPPLALEWITNIKHDLTNLCKFEQITKKYKQMNPFVNWLIYQCYFIFNSWKNAKMTDDKTLTFSRELLIFPQFYRIQARRSWLRMRDPYFRNRPLCQQWSNIDQRFQWGNQIPINRFYRGDRKIKGRLMVYFFDNKAWVVSLQG